MADIGASDAPDPGKQATAKTGTGGATDLPGLAWAIFEWARNPYYIIVVIYVFAPYFARDVIGADILASGRLEGLDEDTARQTANAEGQAAIASVTKWAGFVGALTAPFLGAALDRGGRRKPVLAILLGIIALVSWMLWWAIPGDDGLSTGTVMVLLVTAYVCYTYSEVTHNAMLTASGRAQSLPMISGIGLGLGNLASVLIFVGLILFFALPGLIGWPFGTPLFGLDLDAHEHQRLAGPLCAVWLLIFSVFFFRYANDGGTPGASWVAAFKEGTKGVFQTLRNATQYREVMKFLFARMLYADAMAALLTLGAVYVALMLRWDFLEMTAYAIVGSIFAFGGGLFGGWLDTRFGPKRALIFEISVMLVLLFFQLSITEKSLFFGLVENMQVWDGLIFQTASDLIYLCSIALLSVVGAASISSSRSMLVHLAPEGRSGEFFGLYAIAGTVTVWLGPLMVQIFTSAFNSQRIGMASIAVLFILGLMVMFTIRTEKTA